MELGLKAYSEKENLGMSSGMMKIMRSVEQLSMESCKKFIQALRCVQPRMNIKNSNQKY